jgi:hypothetical protein
MNADHPFFYLFSNKASIESLYPFLLAHGNASNPSPPTVTNPAKAIAGKYKSDAYGEMELCYVPTPSSNATSNQSESCKQLIDSAPTILPGVIDAEGEDDNALTFLVFWNGMWASHARFRHYDGNLFNISMVNSVVSLDLLFPSRFFRPQIYVCSLLPSPPWTILLNPSGPIAASGIQPSPGQNSILIPLAVWTIFVHLTVSLSSEISGAL